MSMTDPIADMLTRIRNGSRVRFKSVDVLNLPDKPEYGEGIEEIRLHRRRYDLKKDPRGQEVLRLYLKYPDAKRTVITGIQRVSKPGRRVYVKSEKIPQVLNGYGISILSTSKGIMTDKESQGIEPGRRAALQCVVGDDLKDWESGEELHVKNW